VSVLPLGERVGASSLSLLGLAQPAFEGLLDELSLIWAVSPGNPLRAMSIAPPASGGSTCCRLDVVREAGDRLGGGLGALLPGDLFGLRNMPRLA
jgi:hypothetical protein